MDDVLNKILTELNQLKVDSIGGYRGGDYRIGLTNAMMVVSGYLNESGCEGKESSDELSNCIKPAVINCVPYQLCPKCGGDGDLLRYNSPALMGTIARPICDVCDGKKIIPMAHCL